MFLWEVELCKTPKCHMGPPKTFFASFLLGEGHYTEWFFISSHPAPFFYAQNWRQVIPLGASHGNRKSICTPLLPALDTKSPVWHTVIQHSSVSALEGARAFRAGLRCVVFYCCPLNHMEECVHRVSCYTICSLLGKMKNIKKNTTMKPITLFAKLKIKQISNV